MNKRLTPEQDLERLLQDDGGEFGAIYGRLSRPEPPRRLDRVVLANAARAVHGGRAPRAQRWAVAMGSVTGVVLAAGIAWQVGKQIQSQDSVPEGSRSMQDSRVVPVEAITEPRPRPKVKSDLIMRDDDAPARAGQAHQEPLASTKEQTRPSPASAMAPPVPMAPPPTQAKPASRRTNELAGKSEPQPAASPAADLAEAEAFPEERDSEMGESATQASRMRNVEKKSSPVMKSRASVPESQSTATAAAAAPASASDDYLNSKLQMQPEAWLEEIERLVIDGHRREAIENLRLFRSRYPDWSLPDTLRTLDQ